MPSCLIGGQVTTKFNAPRPVSNPGLHIHGALDLAGGDGIIRAPAAGIARGYVIFRAQNVSRPWAKDDEEKPEVFNMPWRNYFQDIYGGFIVLIEPNGRMHLFCHIWPAAILNSNKKVDGIFHTDDPGYIETAGYTQWPTHINKTNQVEVVVGQALAPVGSAGQSTGAHVHWEIHHQSNRLDDYAKRIDPTEYLR